MEKDIEVTEVVFRKYISKKLGTEVFALMPYSINSGYYVDSYQHTGQHSVADYNHCIRISEPATEKEYSDLLIEMENLGYNIKPIQKYSHKKYLQAYWGSRK